MLRKILPFVAIAAIAGCKTPAPVTETTTTTVETPDEKLPPTPEIYNPAAKRSHDLLHTKVEVSFDWKNRHLHGQATLRLKPYFYSTNELVLDAKGFEIKQVARLGKEGKKVLPYEYDGAKMRITLDGTFTRNDEFEIWVDYIAKPEELEVGGSAAISSDKGLYFINHDGSQEGKMPQIWTQGETEASSCWFPTIDKPNERMTQELLITVDKKYTTLSNGLLIFSTDNGDGTRTDYWKQKDPHAPYLAMMSVGEFEIVEDVWRDSIAVNYYVEKEWVPYAKDIFGDTPDMLEFFSTRLGVDYPWEKYSQIVVRDYVSGAMENTTAVIHGDFLYRNPRQLLDGNNESIIAHELFHHWFGDYVTCESWSNLPLNESFANYSQFLWDEHRHGRDEADFNAYSEMQGYLFESRTKQEDLIRFDYMDKEDMFDGHSYNKGGRILHMLRIYLGDDAFFEGLRVYLEDNKHTAVEVHNLRLAFEKVSGEDLNWYFNQWFLSSGHPKLDISYDYDSATSMQHVIVEQTQNFDKTPLFRLPMKIDVWENGKNTTHEVEMTKHKQTFSFKTNSVPSWVNVDADKVLLCQKNDQKTDAQWAAQYAEGPLLLDRLEALEAFEKSGTADGIATVVSALKDKYTGLQIKAMGQLKFAVKQRGPEIREELRRLAMHPKAPVRAAAIKNLSKYFGKEEGVRPLFEMAVKDSSYNTQAAGLKAINGYDQKRAFALAQELEGEYGTSVKNAVANIYADMAGPDKNQWFVSTLSSMSGFESFGFIGTYAKYLKKQDDKTVNAGLDVFKSQAQNGGTWWMKMPGYNALTGLESHYQKKALSIQTKIEAKTEEGADAMALADLERELNNCKSQEARIQKVIADLKAGETDPRLKKMFGRD